MTSYYNSVQYPWADNFEQVYHDLEAVAANVPANYQTAYQAAMKTANTIDDMMQAGTTIDADTVNEFLFAAHNLVARFPSGNLPQETGQTYSNSTPGGAIEQTFGLDTALTEIETVAVVGAVVVGALLLLPVLLGRK